MDDDDSEFDDLLSPSERRRKKVRKKAEEMAAFCLVTGVPPSEYLSLTIAERNAFIRLAKRR